MSTCGLVPVFYGRFRTWPQWNAAQSAAQCRTVRSVYLVAECGRVERLIRMADETTPDDEYEIIECAHRIDESRDLPVCASRGRFVGGVWRSA